MTDILEIEGIGPKYADDLRNRTGVKTVEALWEAGQTRKGRRDLATETGISEKLIVEWFNHADLMRVRGIAAEYADLLEEAGVDSVRELSHRVPKRLHDKHPQSTRIGHWKDVYLR